MNLFINYRINFISFYAKEKFHLRSSSIDSTMLTSSSSSKPSSMGGGVLHISGGIDLAMSMAGCEFMRTLVKVHDYHIIN